MKHFRRLFRLIQINFILTRYGLDQLVLSLHLFRPLRFLSYFNPWNWGVNRSLTRGQRLRLAFEALGPIFVKFGQALSTRRDLLPEDIADELARLQDQVPPFSGEIARAIIEKAYGHTLTTVFSNFNITPLASASISQVHAATLLDGKEVVVKVLRPNIEKIIRQDVDLLYILAGFAERYWSEGRRLRPREVVAEFERCLIDELDLLREAANAAQLRRNFLHSPLLYIPEVYWNYTRKNILVQERIYGTPVSDFSALREQGIDLKMLAERGVEIFFTQVFRDCFFHADMHPGNIFVAVDKPKNPQYIAVDFGIVGTLSPFDQRYLAENLLAFFNRDYRRVAELHVESGWAPNDIRVEEFESAIRTACEPVFERPLKEISLGRLLLQLHQAARRFGIELQPQLILLQKTLFNVEGLGRQLYPDLDLWVTAKPVLESWLKTQIGPRAFFRKLYKNAPYWAERFPEIPDLLYQGLMEFRGRARQQPSVAEVAKQAQQYRRNIRTNILQVGVGSALLSWALIMGLAQHPSLPLLEKPMFSLGLGVVGFLLLLCVRLPRKD